MIKPRIRSLPAALGTRGNEIDALATELGYTLDGWQRLAVNDLVATNDAGLLAAFEGVLIVSRQCGKSLLGELYALHWALQGETVMYTTHRADTAKEIFRRLLASLPDEFGANPTFTNGKEQVRFPSGGVILFRTRGPRVGRGFTLDKLVVDECQICDREALDAVMPALRTRPGAQVLYLGCAPDARINGNCDVINELRERAKLGVSESLCYLEWSAGHFDGEGVELQAHELTDAMLDDEKQWLNATPAIESGRITIDRMRVERDAMDASSFAVEYLSIGVWPSAAGAAGPLSVEAWEGLVDVESEIATWDAIPEVALGFDVSPDRKVAVCLVAYRDDGRLHLDLVDIFTGMNAAVKAIGEIFTRDDIDIRYIVADGDPQNLDLMARLRQEYIPEDHLCFENASRVGVQSCSNLIDLVNEDALRHRGQLEFTAAIRGAVIKVLSDSWVYSRSRSRSDVSPLLAGAAALWKASVEFSPAGSRNVVIIY